MGKHPRVVSEASEMAPDQRYCTCCKKPLSGKVAWLELDQRSDTYHDFGGVPDDRSQGWFPFGMTCAKRELVVADRIATLRAALTEAAIT